MNYYLYEKILKIRLPTLNGEFHPVTGIHFNEDRGFISSLEFLVFPNQIGGWHLGQSKYYKRFSCLSRFSSFY